MRQLLFSLIIIKLSEEVISKQYTTHTIRCKGPSVVGKSATSALISMKAAYSEVAETDLVDKVNQVGEMIMPKHMVTCGEFLYSL